MTERDKQDNHYSEGSLPKEPTITTEAELDSYIEEMYEDAIGDAGGPEVRQYFFDQLVPTLKEIYTKSYHRAAARAKRVIENGSNLSVSKIGEYFRRAIRPEEISFSRLPKEQHDKIFQDVQQAILHGIEQLRKRYGDDVKMVDAVIVYGSFADNTFTQESDIDVIYITASGDKSDLVEGEYVDAEGELTTLLAEKTGRDIDQTMTIDISQPDSLHQYVEDNRLLSQAILVISPDSALKEKVESVLRR